MAAASSPPPTTAASPTDSTVANGAARLRFTLNVPFPSALEAQIAHGSLMPDAEPRKGGISKELRVTGNCLNVHWEADEARILRVSISTFLDLLALVLETMDRFGPPVPR
uniref:L antigen family member 3 n=2 Tax=Callorhinchus milii TaxID=7868 RepID=V9LCS2_CALMI|eukprot:gi/632992097/ref/XP_007884921.1/ PREDICTED: EKC/KEOPS complex subunit LAGE3 [Callorhinchus milii]